eukprot:TRINITY_DN1991_c0_g1_i1.p2 TRINITY_DN1991_c0_g1~~TRINITY_DN1991_c0_g1_i1.p2  ORF type:complete len:384 (-),score=118.88 TRINITY_DN1991_c0_g1_i1:124-1275(-)
MLSPFCYGPLTVKQSEETPSGKSPTKPPKRQPTEKSMVRGKLSLKVGISVDEGRRTRMEDICILYEDFKASEFRREDSKLKDSVLGEAFFAVYDGHAGLEAADFMSDNAHVYLANHPSYYTNVQEAFVDAFEQAEKEFLKMANEKEILSGTTALSVLVRGNQLFVANTGDSRAVLCRNGKAVGLSADHRPDREDERRRVEEAGGWILAEEVLNVPRLYRLHLDEVMELEEAEDLIGWVTVRKVNGVLGMTRSIGDRLIKGTNKDIFFGQQFGGELVLPTPEITTEDIASKDSEFMILASDGLWDVLSSQEAVDFVRQRLYPGRVSLDLERKRADSKDLGIRSVSMSEVPQPADVMEVAQELLCEAIEAGSLDNISVIIVQFHT